MENSESVSSHRVSDIVLEYSYGFVFWADIGIGRRTCGMLLEIVPVAISIRSSSMISNEMIVRMSQPEASRCLISVQ